MEHINTHRFNLILAIDQVDLLDLVSRTKNISRMEMLRTIIATRLKQNKKEIIVSSQQLTKQLEQKISII